MRILITNDDGINAPGLEVLTAIATEVAGDGGEVWTVAPAFEQSGVAHCISYVHPTMIAELGPRRFAAEGTPADCVLAAIHDVMIDAPPDLILSGVNRGNNAGQNAMYSGTLGAAMEGALQRYPSIALSQYYGQRNLKIDDPFEASAVHGADIVRRLWQTAPWGGDGFQLFYNVNFPPVPAAEVTGTAVVAQGSHDFANHSVQPHTAPNGRRFLWVTGKAQNVPTAPGTDVHANLEGQIAVTPMRADLTAYDMLSDVRAAME